MKCLQKLYEIYNECLVASSTKQDNYDVEIPASEQDVIDCFNILLDYAYETNETEINIDSFRLCNNVSDEKPDQIFDNNKCKIMHFSNFEDNVNVKFCIIGSRIIIYFYMLSGLKILICDNSSEYNIKYLTGKWADTDEKKCWLLLNEKTGGLING